MASVVKVTGTLAEMEEAYNQIKELTLYAQCSLCPMNIELSTNENGIPLSVCIIAHYNEKHKDEVKPANFDKSFKIICPWNCGKCTNCSIQSGSLYSLNLFNFKKHGFTQLHRSDWESAAGLTVLQRIADMPNMLKLWISEADADKPEYIGKVVIIVTDSAMLSYISQSHKLKITLYMRYADGSTSVTKNYKPAELFSTQLTQSYLPGDFLRAEDSLFAHKQDPRKYHWLYTLDGNPLVSYLLWDEAKLREIAISTGFSIPGAYCLVCLQNITACPANITGRQGHCNGTCCSTSSVTSETYCFQAVLDAQGANFTVLSSDRRDASQLRPNCHEKCTFTCLDCQGTFKRRPTGQTQKNSACPICKSPNVAESAINKFLVLLNNGWRANNGHITFDWIAPLRFDHYNDILKIAAETHSRFCHSKIEDTMNDIKKMLGALKNNNSYIFWDIMAYFACLRTLQNFYKAIVHAHKVIVDYRANNQGKNCVVYIPPPGPRFAGYEAQCQAARNDGYEVIVIELGCHEASQAHVPNGDRTQRLIDEFYGKEVKRARDDEDKENGV